MRQHTDSPWLLVAFLFCNPSDSLNNYPDPFAFSHQHFFLNSQCTKPSTLPSIISPTNQLPDRYLDLLDTTCLEQQKRINLYAGTQRIANITMRHVAAHSEWTPIANEWGLQAIHDCNHTIPFSIQTHRGFTEHNHIATQYRIYEGNSSKLMAYVWFSEDNLDDITIRSPSNSSILATATLSKIGSCQRASWEVWNNSTLPPQALAFLLAFKETIHFNCTLPLNPKSHLKHLRLGLVISGAVAAVALLLTGIALEVRHYRRKLDPETAALIQ